VWVRRSHHPCRHIPHYSSVHSKDEPLFYLKKIKQRAEVEQEGRLKALRTDRGGEFNSTFFDVFCSEQGIKHYTTTPYSPQQNGVVERRNQSAVEMTRCLLQSKGVPPRFLGEAVTTAVCWIGLLLKVLKAKLLMKYGMAGNHKLVTLELLVVYVMSRKLVLALERCLRQARRVTGFFILPLRGYMWAEMFCLRKIRVGIGTVKTVLNRFQVYLKLVKYSFSIIYLLR
jgi:transposase InsO family protein